MRLLNIADRRNFLDYYDEELVREARNFSWLGCFRWWSMHLLTTFPTKETATWEKKFHFPLQFMSRTLKRKFLVGARVPLCYVIFASNFCKDVNRGPYTKELKVNLL